MKARRTAAVLTLLLSASPTVRLSAQGDVDRLALRFASMTAVTGLEQAMVDSLRALFPGSTRDHVGNVKSTHLTRGRSAPGTPDPVFTVDNAYVDVGATSAAEAQGLGIAVLAPVSLAKRPQLYGERLLAAPVAGRRATPTRRSRRWPSPMRTGWSGKSCNRWRGDEGGRSGGSAA